MISVKAVDDTLKRMPLLNSVMLERVTLEEKP